MHLDVRGQPRFDRKRGEYALRERVERADRRVVELVEPHVAAGALRIVEVLVARTSLELTAHAIAELGRRLLGERNRGDCAHRHRQVGTVGRDELHDPVDEHLRLSGARARLDEERLVEPVAHDVAGNRVAHSALTAPRSARRSRPARVRCASAATPGACPSCRGRRGRSTRTRCRSRTRARSGAPGTGRRRCRRR